MTRLTVVIYGVNNPIQTKEALRYARENSDPDLTDIFCVDNGSSPPYECHEWGADDCYHYDENIGGNAVFHRWMKDQDDWFFERPEFIAFIHCDLYIREPGWDHRIVDAFDMYPKLALQGFVGSDEIDNLGGRGGGTCLNYLGAHYEGIGQASPAEKHGRRERGITAAAVLDHCSLIFRTSVLEQLTPQEGYYAPEHFYDRIICCEVLERGDWIAVNGISCDHFSGGIGGGIPNAHKLRLKWLKEENISVIDPSSSKETHDLVYLESEKRFFARCRSVIFPCKVDAGTHHVHHRW